MHCSRSCFCRTSWRFCCKHFARGLPLPRGAILRRPAGTLIRVSSHGRSGFWQSLPSAPPTLRKLSAPPSASIFCSAFRWKSALSSLPSMLLLVLYLQNKGFRRVEALIITLLGVIALCFLTQIIMAQPQWGEVIKGLRPPPRSVSNPDMLYIALGIIGATVMPHNLYLHSGIVQTRDYGHTTAEKREAIRYATLDSTIALTFALVINASILILQPQQASTRPAIRVWKIWTRPMPF